jgi:hypothetical protein
VYAGVDVSCGRVNGGHHALVATRSLEGVQTCPVSWQVDRLKDVDIDRRAGRIKNQCRIAKTGAPASVDKQSVDVVLQPAALKPDERMMVGATWRQASVRSQALEGPGHTAPLSRWLSVSSTVTYDILADAELALDRYAIHQSESPPGHTWLCMKARSARPTGRPACEHLAGQMPNLHCDPATSLQPAAAVLVAPVIATLLR